MSSLQFVGPQPDVPRFPACDPTRVHESLGVPPGLARLTGRAMDAAITHGPAPRIVLDVFAREPEE